MAPANKHGYALLPQDDISMAGGPLVVPRGICKRSTSDLWNDEVDDIDAKTHGKYDGGRRFDASVPKLVIHPFNPVVQTWNCGLVGLLISDVIVLPVESAFGYALPHAIMFWFNLLSTTLFSLDIFLQFFLQIPSPSGDYWIFNHRRIIHSYITGFFCIDVVSVIPFSEVCWLLEEEGHASKTEIVSQIYLVRVLRFVKLLRMVRLKRIAKRFEYDLNLTYMQRAIVYCFTTIFLSLHIMSCIWATMGNYQMGDDWESYVKREKLLDLNAGSDLVAHEGYHAEEDLPLVKYTVSFYFALYTLTGIGYGDVVPVTWFEYVFSIGMMLVGSLIWATIIGEIVGVLKNAHIDELMYQDTCDNILVMGREFELPSDLQRRIKDYVTQQRQTAHTNFVHDRVIKKMSSELAIQLTHVLHAGWFNHIWWLQKVSRTPFMVELTLAFEMMLYCPSEEIRAMDRLYVIQHGLCVHGSQVLSKNKCFGVDFLLSQDHLRLKLATIALSYLHTMYLTREALQKTVQHYPREAQLVRRSYRTLCVMRGIVHEARKIRQREKEEARQVREEAKRIREEARKAANAWHEPPSPSLCGDNERNSPGKPQGFLEQMGSKKSTSHIFAPSQALVSHATATEVSDAILETRGQLEQLEVDITSRIDVVETHINSAMEMISEFIARKTGKSLGSDPSLR